MRETVEAPVRLSEIVAALSLATDLGMGQPMEQAMITCLLSVNAGRALGLNEQTLSDVYYLSLLRFIGCTADASEMAAANGGDDISERAGLAPVLNGSNSEILLHVVRNFAEGAAPLARLRLLVPELIHGTGNAKRSIADHCHVAQMLASRIGFSPTVADYVGSTFERWDGKGLPGELAGEAIPMACRIVLVSRDVEVLHRLGRWDLVSGSLESRSGKAYDPAVASVFQENGERWLSETSAGEIWEAVLESEPGPHRIVPEAQLDDVLTAIGDLGDLKCPYSAGHSRAVAELAAGAAAAAGLDQSETALIRRAGLLHDLGKVGVPSGILDKPGPLSRSEWERVRLHPYMTERVVSSVPALRSVAAVASAHHERLDGSGYHRGIGGQSLSNGSRILAAANSYHSLTQSRPYRAALDGASAARELRNQAEVGKLDRRAVECVLEATGQGVRVRRSDWPVGLTEREVEVLRLIAFGNSNREVAETLTLSIKTVGRHIENIYAKTGISSRATAALFAMEHRLL